MGKKKKKKDQEQQLFISFLSDIRFGYKIMLPVWMPVDYFCFLSFINNYCLPISLNSDFSPESFSSLALPVK